MTMVAEQQETAIRCPHCGGSRFNVLRLDGKIVLACLGCKKIRGLLDTPSKMS